MSTSLGLAGGDFLVQRLATSYRHHYLCLGLATVGHFFDGSADGGDLDDVAMVDDGDLHTYHGIGLQGISLGFHPR